MNPHPPSVPEADTTSTPDSLELAAEVQPLLVPEVDPADPYYLAPRNEPPSGLVRHALMTPEDMFAIPARLASKVSWLIADLDAAEILLSERAAEIENLKAENARLVDENEVFRESFSDACAENVKLREVMAAAAVVCDSPLARTWATYPGDPAVFPRAIRLLREAIENVNG